MRPATIGAIAARRSASGSTPADWANVQLLMHGDASPFVDSSSFARTVTNSGMTLDTTNKKFGAGSMRATTSQYLTVGSASDWTFLHSGMWTAEFQFLSSGFSGSRWFLSTCVGSSLNHGILLYMNTSRQVQLYIPRGVDSSPALSGTFTGLAYPNDTSNFVHVAVCCDMTLGSNNATCWINGASAGTLSRSNAPSSSTPTRTLRISDSTSPPNMEGRMDELRITKDQILYTGAFTPPTAAFPES